jgi:5-methylcytosine-specific restriction protein A
MNFENRYGVLGRRFAEAHHVRQLGKTKEGTRIVADDLITVCANCHRMLHRMRGRKDDWLVLRRIVRKHSRGG